MKNLIIVLAMLIGSISNTYAQQSIEGIWNTGKENTTIEIKKTEGKIHSSENLKATPNMLMIKDLKKSNNEFKGKLYVIKKDKWVDAVFVPIGNTLTVTVSAGFQSKTLKWNMIKK